MSGAARLYTPELLALAVELGRFPYNPGGDATGFARSKSCGSTLSLSMEINRNGEIGGIGLKVQACAVGQAAAAIFAEAAEGKRPHDFAETAGQLSQWLAGEGARPDWPGISVLDAARAYPGRHGAIMLPWRAALDALSKRNSNG